MGMKNSTSVGWDEINITLLKRSAPIVSKVLCMVINQSFNDAVFPHKLKQSIIKPLHKKGSQKNIDNYRPISLLSNVSKIFEKVIHQRLYYYLEFNGLLSKSQYGFRKNLNTNMTLVDFVNEVMQSLDGSENALAVFCDLSKAFDCVNHQLLLSKIKNLGIQSKAFKILQSYLSNRSQRTMLINNGNKHYSKWSNLSCGVPQGSTLGPLFFLIFINTLTTDLKYNFYLYADDTTLLLKNQNIQLLIQDTTNCLNETEKWFENNGLLLNNSKTKIIKFEVRSLDKNTVNYLNQNNITTTTSHKFLGLVLDANLNWKECCLKITSKLNSISFAFKILRETTTTETCRSVYYAYVESVIRYGIMLWGSSSYSKYVIYAQKSIIRNILSIPRRHSCREAFKELNILTLVGIFIYEHVKYILQNPLLYKKYKFTHAYNTRKTQPFNYPRHRLTLYEQSPLYVGLKIFNNLPQNILNDSEDNILIKLKTFLLNKAYYTLSEFFHDTED